ncbi:MAG: EVE domain-containing protein [Actinomycetota bacterium]
MARYWIIVGSPENFERTKALGFGVQGMKSRHRRKAEGMEAGDKLVWYVTGEQAFAGYATITGGYFEDHEPIWSSGRKKGEDYPWRVPIVQELVLVPSKWVAAEGVARRMTYVSKWPAEHWRLAFQGNVHEISEGDFQLVRAALEKAAKGEAA